jgi:hypothetical protein
LQYRGGCLTSTVGRLEGGAVIEKYIIRRVKELEKYKGSIKIEKLYHIYVNVDINSRESGV